MRRQHHDARGRIMQAALFLYAENGFEDSTTHKIAKLADVGVNRIYEYFKTKDELIQVLYCIVEDSLNAKLITKQRTCLDDKQRFIERLILLINYFRQHPQEFQFLDHYRSSRYYLGRKSQFFGFEDNVKPTNPFSEFYSDRVKSVFPASLYLAMIFGPVNSLLRDSFTGVISLDDCLVRQTAETCWNAIAL